MKLSVRACLFFTAIAFSFCVNAQSGRDSIVYSKVTSYSGEHVEQTVVQEIRYRNGKEVYALTTDGKKGGARWLALTTYDAGGKEISVKAVGCKGKECCDSMVILTTYDSNGKKIKKECRKITSHWADSSSYIVTEVQNSRGDAPFGYSYASQRLLDSLMRKPKFNCPQIEIIDSIFSDSMEIVSVSTYSLGSFLNRTVDSLFYFQDHRLKSVIRYMNNDFNGRTDYSFIFNEKDQVIESKITWTNSYGRTQNVSITKYLYDPEGKQLRYLGTSFELNEESADTLHLAIDQITYNEQFKPVFFIAMSEGRLFNYRVIQYNADNSAVVVLYNKDSLPVNKQYGWQRFSPGKTETWFAVDNMNGRKIVASYKCVDTVMRRGKMIVREYSGIYEEQLFVYAPVPKKKCKTSSTMVYDDKKRLLEIESYSYKAKYRYSR
jgi:hypothetical protein